MKTTKVSEESAKWEALTEDEKRKRFEAASELPTLILDPIIPMELTPEFISAMNRLFEEWQIEHPMGESDLETIRGFWTDRYGCFLAVSVSFNRAEVVFDRELGRDKIVSRTDSAKKMLGRALSEIRRKKKAQMRRDYPKQGDIFYGRDDCDLEFVKRQGNQMQFLRKPRSEEEEAMAFLVLGRAWLAGPRWR